MEIKPFIDFDSFTKEAYEEIDSANLHKAVSTQTARHAYYSALAVQARRQKDKIALEVAKLRAGLTKAYRKKLNDEAASEAESESRKPERVTNDMVNAEVILNADMQRYEALQLDADEVYGLCKVAQDAFFTRKEMLKLIGNVTVESLRKDMKFQSAERDISDYHARRAQRHQGGAQE